MLNLGVAMRMRAAATMICLLDQLASLRRLSLRMRTSFANTNSFRTWFEALIPPAVTFRPLFVGVLVSWVLGSMIEKELVFAKQKVK